MIWVDLHVPALFDLGWNVLYTTRRKGTLASMDMYSETLCFGYEKYRARPPSPLS